jgi:hypothetical protein
MGPPRVLFTILAMVPPSKSQMGYENPSEGAVRIAAGHLITTICASDSEVKQVILLPGSGLQVPRALVDRGGRSPRENSLAVLLLAVYEYVATLFACPRVALHLTALMKVRGHHTQLMV